MNEKGTFLLSQIRSMARGSSFRRTGLRAGMNESSTCVTDRPIDTVLFEKVLRAKTPRNHGGGPDEFEPHSFSFFFFADCNLKRKCRD